MVGRRTACGSTTAAPLIDRSGVSTQDTRRTRRLAIVFRRPEVRARERARCAAHCPTDPPWAPRGKACSLRKPGSIARDRPRGALGPGGRASAGPVRPATRDGRRPAETCVSTSRGTRLHRRTSPPRALLSSQGLLPLCELSRLGCPFFEQLLATGVARPQPRSLGLAGIKCKKRSHGKCRSLVGLMELSELRGHSLQTQIVLRVLGVCLRRLDELVPPSLQSDRFDRTAKDDARAAIAIIILFTVNRRRGSRKA